MLKTGHQGAALLLYAPVGYVLLAIDPGLAVIGLVGTVALSMLPDVDMRIPFVAHRGVTHTLLFVAVTAAALAAAGRTFADAMGLEPAVAAPLGAIVGVTAVGSHLLADALTPAGIPALWPLTDRRFSAGVVRADNPVVNYLLFVVGIAATGALAQAAGVF